MTLQGNHGRTGRAAHQQSRDRQTEEMRESHGHRRPRHSNPHANAKWLSQPMTIRIAPRRQSNKQG